MDSTQYRGAGFSPVTERALPGFTCPDGLPQVSKTVIAVLTRSNDAMILANQFGMAVATDLDKFSLA